MEGKPGPTPGARRLIDEIKHALRLLILATCLLYVVVFAALGYGYYRSNQIHNSLCTFRSDLESRVTQTEDFLATHPEGFPGVPKATLLQGLENQRRTIEALGELHC